MKKTILFALLAGALLLWIGMGAAQDDSLPDEGLPDETPDETMTPQMTDEEYAILWDEVRGGWMSEGDIDARLADAQNQVLEPEGVEGHILRGLVDMYNEVADSPVEGELDSALVERIRVYMLTGVDPETRSPPPFGVFTLTVIDGSVVGGAGADAEMGTPGSVGGGYGDAPDGELPSNTGDIPPMPQPPLHLCYCDHQHGILDAPCYSQKWLDANSDADGNLNPLGQGSIDMASALGNLNQAQQMYADAAQAMERVRAFRIAGGAFMGDYEQVGKGLGVFKTAPSGGGSKVNAGYGFSGNSGVSMVSDMKDVIKTGGKLSKVANFALSATRYMMGPVFQEAFDMADRDAAAFDMAERNLAQAQAALAALQEQLGEAGLLNNLTLPKLVSCREDHPCWHWNFEGP